MRAPSDERSTASTTCLGKAFLRVGPRRRQVVLGIGRHLLSFWLDECGQPVLLFGSGLHPGR